MKLEAKNYLIVLSRFAETATRATFSVKALIQPGEPLPDGQIMEHLRKLFGAIKPWLIGVDPQYNQSIRQLYGALLDQIMEHYHSFHHSRLHPNPHLRPSPDGHYVYQFRVDAELSKFVVMATEETYQTMARLSESGKL